MDEEVEGVVVAGVGELVVRGWQLLEALRGDRREVPGVLRVLRQHHRPPRHEAIYKPPLLLPFPHLLHLLESDLQAIVAEEVVENEKKN